MEYLTELHYNPKKQSVIEVGSTQTGKTTDSISRCKALVMKGYNVLILDKKRRFTVLDPNAVIHTINEVTGKGLQILQPHQFTNPNEMFQFFEDLSWQAYLFHNLVFVIDELHSWFKDKRTHIPSFEMFCRECHNQNSSFMAIFQSPSEVPTYVMRNAHHKFVLYLDLDQDVETMKRVIGKEMKLFRENLIAEYEGLYKEKGKPVKLFKVVKSD